MKSGNRSLTIRVSDELRAAMTAAADAQQRSLANFLLWHLTCVFLPADAETEISHDPLWPEGVDAKVGRIMRQAMKERNAEAGIKEGT